MALSAALHIPFPAVFTPPSCTLCSPATQKNYSQVSSGVCSAEQPFALTHLGEEVTEVELTSLVGLNQVSQPARGVHRVWSEVVLKSTQRNTVKCGWKQ